MDREIFCGGMEKEIYLHASGAIYFCCEVEVGIFDGGAKGILRMSLNAASDGAYSSGSHLLLPSIDFAYSSDDDRFVLRDLGVSDVCVLISPTSLS